MTKFKFLSFTTVFFLSACGGGSSEPEPIKTPSITYSNYSITAIDGYLANADVWLDTQKSGVYISTNPTALTNSNGSATLNIPNTINAQDYPVIVEAKKSITFDKGLNRLITNNFTLAAPAGEKVVTPYTTFVYLKMQSGMPQQKAVSDVAKLLKVPVDEVLADFIALNNERMTLIAADLVRLDVLPTSPGHLAQAVNSQNKINTDLAIYADIQSDITSFKSIAKNSSQQLELDTDSDGTADSDDIDIDGDSIPNELDTHPYLFDRHTASSPSELKLSAAKAETILSGQWHYFKLNTPEDILLNITLSQLTGDVDLYIKQDAIPTKFDYHCRSNNSYQIAEKCLQRLKKGQTHYIAVTAKDDSNYLLSALLDEIVISKATLLLHGLASEAGTWDKLVNDDSFFSGSCANVNIRENLSTLPQVNSKGESCFRLDFGGYDRDSNLGSKGLDGKSCITAEGCNGDFSRFELLGKEVETVIDQIVTKLGVDTEIVILGHSRGGLAARAYIQNTASTNKEYVKALITTGTPHQGSPLGRIYRYMEDNCTPKSIYRQDGSVCEDSWEVIEMLAGVRTFLGFNYSKEYQIDLLAPSIDFLSPESTEIAELNANILALENIIIAQMSYRGTKFGILAEDVTPRGDYDLYEYQQLFGGDHPHPSTLRYIEKGQTRESYIGDGIVPAYSQQLSLLLTPYNKNVDLTISIDRAKVLHTEQTDQISDLNSMYSAIRTLIGWKI